jgi:hypothetical protein
VGQDCPTYNLKGQAFGVAMLRMIDDEQDKPNSKIVRICLGQIPYRLTATLLILFLL